MTSFFTAQKHRSNKVKRPGYQAEQRSSTRSNSSDATKPVNEVTYELTMIPLYHAKGRFNFYDNSWKEKLNTLKPSGLLTLIMGCPIEGHKLGNVPNR